MTADGFRGVERHMTKRKPKYVCAKCGRQIKRWVRSKATKNRYCWPGEGCNK